MAAAKKGSARDKKPQGKYHGRLPSKNTINLVLNDDRKLDWRKAIPAILLIIVLAIAFAKFLVLDRLNEVDKAAALVAALRDQLDSMEDQIESIGEIEDIYAHYTIDGMTKAELGLVDRVDIMNLVRRVQIANASMSTSEFSQRLSTAGEVMRQAQDNSPSWSDIGSFIRNSLSELMGLRREANRENTTWSVTGNVLTVNVSGLSLQTLNDVAQMLEQNPIVDSCVLTTANKTSRTDVENRVSGRYIVYLKQPSEPEATAKEVAQP